MPTIKKCNYNDIIDNNSNLYIGRNGDYKCTYIKNFIYHAHNKKNIDGVYVFSPRDKIGSFYSSFLPEENIFFEFDIRTIEKILDKQKYYKKTNKKNKILIILDDCLSYNKRNYILSHPIFREFAINAKKYDITYFLMMQYPIELDLELRTSFDYIFLFDDYTVANQKKLHKYYFSNFETFEEFRKIFTKATYDYNLMVALQKNKEIFCLCDFENLHDFTINKICEFYNKEYLRETTFDTLQNITNTNNNIVNLLQKLA